MIAGIGKHGSKDDRGVGRSESVVETRDTVSILCVDDNRGILETLTSLLRREGWAVQTAASLRKGLARARAGSFGALVLDLKLPDGSGLEIVHCLRREGIDTPAVVLTGHPSVESAIEATKLGVRYLVKGRVNQRSIVDTIREILHQARSESTGRDLVRLTITQLLEELASGERIVPTVKGAASATFARLVCNRDVPFKSFVIAAQTLRALLDPGTLDSRLVELVRQQIVRLSHAPDVRADAAVERFLAHVETTVVQWRALNREGFGNNVRIDASSIDRLLGSLGLSWLQFRRAMRMRRAAADLAHGEDYVSQIAYRLGYDHPSAFDRDFQLFSGAAPTQFRQLTQV